MCLCVCGGGGGGGGRLVGEMVSNPGSWLYDIRCLAGVYDTSSLQTPVTYTNTKIRSIARAESEIFFSAWNPLGPRCPELFLRAGDMGV